MPGCRASCTDTVPLRQRAFACCSRCANSCSKLKQPERMRRQLAVCSGIVSIKRSSNCCGTDGDAWASHFGQDIGANSDICAIVLSLLIWVSMTGLAHARGTKVGCAVNARFAGLRMVVCALCGSLGRVRSQETRQITRYQCCPNYRRWCSLL